MEGGGAGGTQPSSSDQEEEDAVRVWYSRIENVRYSVTNWLN